MPSAQRFEYCFVIEPKKVAREDPLLCQSLQKTLMPPGPPLIKKRSNARAATLESLVTLVIKKNRTSTNDTDSNMPGMRSDICKVKPKRWSMPDKKSTRNG